MMKLNAVGMLCADLEASIAFYRALGVGFREFSADDGHYEADLGGGIRLMLDSHEVARSFIDDFSIPTGNDIIGLAVELDSAGEVDAVYSTMIESGSTSVREPFDAFWGQRYATIADPDGNSVDLYAPLT